MQYKKPTETTPPKRGFRDIEVMFSSGTQSYFRIYTDMYDATMSHMQSELEGNYTYIVVYRLDWSYDIDNKRIGTPRQGKSFINLAQVCSIDIVGMDNERV